MESLRVRTSAHRHTRRRFLATSGGLALVAAIPGAAFAVPDGRAEKILSNWYRLILELIRHTATYSPPVASRSFAYLGVTAFEVMAATDTSLRSMAGQVNGLSSLPRAEGAALDAACVLQSALGAAVLTLFGNTGPTGQRAMAAMAEKLEAVAVDGVDPALAEASSAFGAALWAAILGWSEGDGGAVVENMGFPMDWQPGTQPGHWQPTSTIAVQQAPLLPHWGKNRPFAATTETLCGLPPPPAYSEDPESEFYRQAMEVVTTTKSLTEEQKIIARFWSDDPMLSPTPPGHWVSIVLQIADREGWTAGRLAEVLAMTSIAVADGFIACWATKYQYDLVRPVTYIRKLIDPKWEPLLNTPPFPEYPSGHSSQSGAAARVLTGLLGEGFAFTDATHVDDGLPERSFASFDEAAREAAISRLYGGIHFMAAIDQGLAQGACVGEQVLRIRTRA